MYLQEKIFRYKRLYFLVALLFIIFSSVVFTKYFFTHVKQTFATTIGTCNQASIFSASADTIRQCPQEIFTAFRNPGKGWLPYSFRPITRPNLPWPGGPADVQDTPLASAVYTNYLTWSDLEPTEGAYRWDYIDTLIKTWQSKKKIKIGIMLPAKISRFGKEPIPDWVRPQIEGGYYSYPDIWEPKYTNAVFIQKYQNFLNALAQRYYNTPADPSAEDWKKYIESIDINTFGVDGEWWSNFAFRSEQVSINPFVSGTATNAPILFSFDDLTVRNSAGIVASDDFSRIVTSKWGSATVGGAYYTNTDSTAVDYNVNGTAGTMNIATAGAGRRARLASVSEHDVDITVKVKSDKTAVGGNYIVDLDARNLAPASTEYFGRLSFRPTGALSLEAFKRVNGVGTNLNGTYVVPGLTHVANTYYWLHMNVTGSNPATIKLNVWQDGTVEPTSWMFMATDSDPVLQDNIGDEKYNTLKTLVDQYLTAFSQTKPELKMNIIGSSANGPTTLQEKDVTAVKYAVDQGNASMIRRMIGFGDANLKPDEIQYMKDHLSTRKFDGEWGSYDGNISWLDNPKDATPLKYTYQAIDQALDLGASYLGWYKTDDYITCSTIPPTLPVEELPEKSQCVNPTDVIIAHPLQKLYPGTNESLASYFQRRSGYRFYITENVYPQVVSPGQAFQLNQAWYQRAVAKLYKQYYLRTFLVKDGNRISLDVDYSSFDAHTWAAGPSGPHATTSTFHVPTTVVAGTYTLQFAVVDQDGNPAMNLAIDGKQPINTTDDPVNDYGYYAIGDISVSTPTLTIIPSPIPTNTPTPVPPTPTATPTHTPTKTPTPTPTPVTLTATLNVLADTYVRKDAAFNNYGSSSTMSVKGNLVRITYLKFDLTSLAGRTIKSAKLKLRVSSSSSGYQNYKIVDTTSWSETTMLYYNRPATGIVMTTYKGGSSGTWITVDVMSGVNLKKGQLFALAIDSGYTDVIEFYTKEISTTTYRPVLIVDYQ